ncbi:unnamed protein product [Linum trigynum]|uniref:Transmembrane protein n=1 Tax=Linum trigynum TaxID=586398 RepID=A0AAV2EXT6_9ROSI
MSALSLPLCCRHGFSFSAGKAINLASPVSSRRKQLNPNRRLPAFSTETRRSATSPALVSTRKPPPITRTLLCHSTPRRKSGAVPAAEKVVGDGSSKAVQVALWVLEGVYIVWLFLLPYAPGDPVWAISSETVNSLIGLSLNFFFILPFLNSVGIHVIEAPVIHPMAEGLFNFVIGWTFMFAPLLFTDNKRNRYPWSLDVLWGCQMFLTNTFLIPYMAIRMNEGDADAAPSKQSQLGNVMTQGAPVVGVIGAAACLVSAIWAVFGRGDSGDFGGITERLEFLVSYLGSERLAYAFIWDICLYIVFQPWLIGENLQNVEESKVDVVKYLRFVPVVGLVAYMLFLDAEKDEQL